MGIRPKVYNREQDTDKLKQILIDTVIDDSGDIDIRAVDKDGDRVAYLLVIDENGITPVNNAKVALDRLGYDTSELGWNEYGGLRIIE